MHSFTRPFLFLLSLLTLTTHLQATDQPRAVVNWTGNGDATSWSDPLNWDSNPALPDATSDVVINPAGINTISLDIDAAIQSLTVGGSNTFLITATATLTLGGASSIGASATMEWQSGTLTGPGLLTNNGQLNMLGNLTKVLTGSIRNNGTVTQASGELALNENGTFTNAGLYDIVTGTHIDPTTPLAGTFTNEATGTLRKSALGGSSVVDVVFVNQGGAVDVQLGTMRILRDSFYNGGTYNAGTGALLEFFGSSFTHTFSGTLSGTPSGTVRISATMAVDAGGATLDFSGTGFEWSTSTINGPGTLTNAGLLKLVASIGGKLNTTLQNNGTIMHSEGPLQITEDGTLNNAGLYDLVDGVDILPFVTDGTINNQATGLFRKSPSGTSEIKLDFFNAGTIEALTGGGVLLFDEVLDHQAGGTIQGTGVIQVNSAIVTNNGTTGPGTSPGALIWTGNFIPSASATFAVEILDTSRAANGGHDSLRVFSGIANLSGTLHISFLPGYVPVVGDQFTILTSSVGVTSTFDTVISPPGAAIDVQYNANSVVLEIVTAPAAALTVLLKGPYNGATLDTDLNSGGLLPLAQPYNTPPYNYAGTETLAAIPADMVDWVLVQLRTGTEAGTQVAQRAGLLKTDGSITDLTGLPLAFNGLAAGSYYAVVRHRNHLDAMSAAPIAVNGTAPAYDFTTGAGQAYGTNATVDLGGGVFGLWGGDGDRNGSTTAFDFLNTWLPINGSPPGYDDGDFDMNGSGTAFDFLTTWLPANGQASQVP